ncbi:putative transmembrane protein [Geobacillus stearothermophilus]|uniref:Transmembrane protein n=2 Tax=Anoxybacillaceae TaxID=3120669 RepID=A0ABQ7HC24_GEOSE|nr:putative transmembrane protein [Geobacillus stearothermophilus]
MMAWLYAILAARPVVWLLLFVNAAGTVYGYYWYRYQLAETPPDFLPFVPDSPTASLFFVLVLAAWLLGRSSPLFEALALVTLVKYGIWAVVMNVLVWRVTGTLDWAGWMLVVSHGAMAVEGALYASFYRFRSVHLALAAVWTLHNDVIDYVFGMMPRYHMLERYADQIGYFTFWLSMASIAAAYWLGIRVRRQPLLPGGRIDFRPKAE